MNQHLDKRIRAALTADTSPADVAAIIAEIVRGQWSCRVWPPPLTTREAIGGNGDQRQR